MVLAVTCIDVLMIAFLEGYAGGVPASIKTVKVKISVGHYLCH